VRPLTERCERIWQRGDHALIGVSTGNSYFSAERLTALLTWARQHFQVVDVICADTQIDTMYLAAGCEPPDATRRAKRRVSAAQRRIRHALHASSAVGGTVRRHALSDFLTDSGYRRLRDRVVEALHTEPAFARACEAMVQEFLSKNADGGQTDAQMTAGLAYVANELPFLIDTPGILGVPSSLSVYHLLPPAVEELYLTAGEPAPAAEQGFAVVAPGQTASEGKKV
jgi:cyclo(L-tyrosyl-L-tyrosyl) synthase